MLKKRIFNKMDDTDLFSKIHVVPGDVTQSDLGVSSLLQQRIAEDVSIVFHCAAVVSFNKPLGKVLLQNTSGTDNVIKFSRRMKKLEAFIHVSTAFSNCNTMDEVREVIYRLPVSSRDLIDTAKAKDEVALDKLASKCQPPWPNTYLFSKAIAEDLLASEASDLPVVIIRPSVIVCTWKGPMPGYIEEGAGISDITVASGKGFIRVLYCDEDKRIDYIPADIVVNTMITAGWSIATKQIEPLFVVNCTSGEINPCTWRIYAKLLLAMQEKYPLPKMYQKPSLVMRKNRITYWASAIVNHYAPAMGIDFILILMGKKPKLTKLYRFYDTALNYLGYFLTNEWRFRCENFKELMSRQTTEDAETFEMNVKKVDYEALTFELRYGSAFYQWEIDKRQPKERLRIAYRRYLLTSFIKWTFISCFVFLLYLILAKLVA